MAENSVAQRTRRILSDLKAPLWLTLLSCCLWTMTGCGGSSDSTETASNDANAGGAGATMSPPGPGGAASGGPAAGAHDQDDSDDSGEMSNGGNPANAAFAGGGGGEHGSDEGAAMTLGSARGGGEHGSDDDSNEGYDETEGAYPGGGYPGGGNPGGGYPGGGYPGGNSASGAGGRGAAPAVAARPANVAMWTEKDFTTAAADRDARVIPALQAFATAPVANADKVNLLKAMLSAMANGPANGARSGGGGAGGGAAGYPGGGYPGGTSGYPGGGSGYPGGGTGYPGIPGGPGGSDGAAPAPGITPGAGSGGAAPAAPKLLGPALPSGASINRKPIGQNIASVQGFLFFSTIGQNAGAMSVRQRVSSNPPGSTAIGSNTGAAPPALGGTGGGAANPGIEYPGTNGGTGAYPGGGSGYPGGGSGAYPGGGSGYPGGGSGYPGGNANGGGQQAVPTTDTRVIAEAIIEHLVKNGSSESESAVNAILRGELPTGLAEGESIGLVLKVLMAQADSPQSKSQLLLSRILNQPESIRPDSPEVLQGAATTMMTSLAVSAVDSMFGLLRPAGGTAASQNARRGSPGAMGGAGMAGFPGMNSGAAGLAGYPGGDDMAEGDFDEDSGNPYGSGGGVPGMPGYGANNAGPANAMQMDVTPLSPEQLNKVVKYLWNPGFTSGVADRIRQSSLTENTELFALAGALPSTTIRKAQYESMQTNHDQGANALLSMGLFDGIARDPGLLVVLKSLPKPKSSSSRTRGRTENSGGDTADSWLSATGHLVNTLKGRFHKAALAAGTKEITGMTLVRLHPGASAPSAVFQVDWPKDARAKVADATPSPMQVHYIRIEESMSDRAIKKVVDHYRVRARGTKREIPGGIWFDGSRATKTGSRISTDIVITQASGRGGGGGYGGGGNESGGPGGGVVNNNYTIEVIAVEIPDPKPNGTQTALK